MLSFEISAIDIVLMVAMLVLLVLTITHRKSLSVAKPQLRKEDEKKIAETLAPSEDTTRNPLKKQSADSFQKCIHQLGYLKDMGENRPIPDECFGCPAVMRCLFPNVAASASVESKAS